MNRDMIEKIAEETPCLFTDRATFIGSSVFKALKKGKIGAEAIVYMHDMCEHWWIKEDIASHCNLTFKEAASSGYLNRMEKSNNLEIYFSSLKEFFVSKEEFLEFTKETFNIDLSLDFKDIPKELLTEEAFSFALALVSNAGISQLFRIGKYATGHKIDIKQLKEFYVNVFPYLFKLLMLTVERKAGRSYYGIPSFVHENPAYATIKLYNQSFWVVDYKFYKEMIDKHVINSKDKFTILSQLAAELVRIRNTSFEGRFISAKGICETLVKDLAELSNSFSDNRFRDDYDYTFESISSLLNSRYHSEASSLIYEYFLSNETKIKNINNISSYSDDKAKLIKFCLMATPSDKVNETFEVLKDIYLPRYAAILTRGSCLAACACESFKPTMEMTECLLEAGYMGWDNVIFPESHFYDMEFIDRLVRKIGKSRVMSSDNHYLANRVDPGKIPVEFFDKYRDYINWYHLSSFAKVEVPFIKRHLDKFDFRNLSSKAAEKLDEETAEYLINIPNLNLSYIIRNIKNLSLEFIAKHFDSVYRMDGDRKMTLAKGDNIRLADIVENLV